jgi:hypothetical protein
VTRTTPRRNDTRRTDAWRSASARKRTHAASETEGAPVSACLNPSWLRVEPDRYARRPGQPDDTCGAGAETPQERDAAVSTQSDHLRVAQLTGGPVTALRIFDVIAWMEGKEQGL